MTSTSQLKPAQLRANPRVFFATAAGIIAISVWAVFAPKSASAALSQLVGLVSHNLGWFYILTGTCVLVFMITVAISPVGNTKLGPDHARPQYGLYSWTSMLFAAGIGVDLLFFSVAEPLTQFYRPPIGTAQTIEAAEQAITLTLFHYGFTGWAMYSLMGMAFGYFAYRFNLPLTIRSALYPIFGRRIQGIIGDSVDVAAMLGTVFGVATSLGIGVVQLNYGLKLLFDLPENRAIQSALIAVAVAIATISAVSGVDKGIKRLSELNVGLALALLTYVGLTGKTAFLLDGLVMNLGAYLTELPGLTMQTYALRDNDAWLNAWTLFFWAWWVAWAPFVGLFLARISRGRTLRQFIIGTFAMPFLFILLWVSIFGNSALDRVLHGDSKLGQAALEAPERAFYQLLEQYPASSLVIGAASLIGLLLYITSADSAALVMSNFTSVVTDSTNDGPRWSRVFWAATTGVLTIAMLLVGGIPTLQSATIVMGLPFAIVMYLIMWGLYRALRLEAYQLRAARMPMPATMASAELHPLSGAAGPARSWTQRLSWAMSYTNAAQEHKYVRTVAWPALSEVVEELCKRGASAQLHVAKVDLPSNDEACPIGGEPLEARECDLLVPDQVYTDQDLLQLDLIVTQEVGRDFRYQLYPVKCALPSYALRLQPSEDFYYRLEVFSLTGSHGYDTMGYTREQIISDVLDHYERHLEFLRLGHTRIGRDDAGAVGSFSRAWDDDFIPDTSIHPDFLRRFTAKIRNGRGRK